MDKLNESEKSEMITNLFSDLDIENMDAREIFMVGVGVGKRFERESPAPEPYSE